jgi:hypothetical protein
MLDSHILMYVLDTSEYVVYLIIEEQVHKERGDDLESDSSASCDTSGVSVIISTKGRCIYVMAFA